MWGWRGTLAQCHHGNVVTLIRYGSDHDANEDFRLNVCVTPLDLAERGDLDEHVLLLLQDAQFGLRLASQPARTSP